MSLQYGIKEVMNLNFYDYATLAPLAYADYAEATTNDVAASRIMVEGGQGK